jgi:hypothetical protein
MRFTCWRRVCSPLETHNRMQARRTIGCKHEEPWRYQLERMRAVHRSFDYTPSACRAHGVYSVCDLEMTVRMRTANKVTWSHLCSLNCVTAAHKGYTWQATSFTKLVVPNWHTIVSRLTTSQQYHFGTHDSTRPCPFAMPQAHS